MRNEAERGPSGHAWSVDSADPPTLRRTPLVAAAHLGGFLVVWSVLSAIQIAAVRGQDRQRDRATTGGAASDSSRSSSAKARGATKQGTGSAARAAPRTKRVAPDASQLLARPFETPRQLLRLMDISESQLSALIDGRAISADDDETLLKILYRLPQIDLSDIARWQQPDVPWDAIRAQPEARRAEFYTLRGRVLAITRRPVRARLADLFGFGQYYEVRFKVADARRATDQRIVVICTREIPRPWQDLDTVNERSRVAAMFLKVGPVLGDPGDTGHDGPATNCLIFAAQRIAWLPDRVDPDLGIGPDQVLLGDLGMDVGLFDSVRDRLPIGAAERECFYQLLAATRRVTPRQLRDRARKVDFVALLQDPARQHGKVFKTIGQLRRITKVLVNEPDIQQRFGIDHYYQLDVFVSLEGRTVEVRGEDGNGPGPVYDDSFPFTFCAIRLPGPLEQLAGKADLNQRVVLRGFFFKLWSYRSPFTSSFAKRQRQLSPMFVLLEPELPAPKPAAESSGGITAGIVFLTILGLIWAAVWWVNRSDRRYAKTVLKERFQSDSPVDFDHLDKSD